MRNESPRFPRPLLLLAVAAAALVVAACGDDDDASDSGDGDARIRVVTTLPLIADFASEVGGDRVEVTSLFPAGADPHTYEPAPRDIQRVAEADIVFANGLDLEPAALRMIRSNIPSGVELVELAEEAEAAGVDIIDFDDHHHDDDDAHHDDDDAHHDDDDAHHDDDDGHGHDDDGNGHAHDEGDPHLWMDIENAREYARIIRDHLAELDPEGSAEYDENYESYMTALDDTDQYVREKVAGIPADNRKLVTTHDAFGYLARYLDFDITAFVAAGPGQDPTPENVANLTTAIEDEGVPAVFTEPQVGGESRVLEQAARDAGVEICTLYSDSLDDRVSSYVELMRFNADELARCLGGAGGG